MRFSYWPEPSQAFSEVKALTSHVEQTGWDGVWLADHFMPNTEDPSGPYPEAWTTIAALAAVIPRIRIGTLVTGNTYRHPAVLAKMAATVDHICNGRLVLGLGSAWQENEHQRYGIPFYTVGSRLKRLEEACQVIRGLFTENRFSFDGKFYQITDAPLDPKPVQHPLPLLIGGGGEKVTLRITAKYANEWNVWGTVDTLKHKMSILDQHCADIGRDPKEISRSAVALLFLSDDEAFIKRVTEDAKRVVIAGNITKVQDTVAAYKEAGVDELIVPDWTMGSGDHGAKREILDRFIEEVAPIAR
jgi:F420-dependent oxidoreductase-like protein